jgi:hypothetical protein
MEKKKLKLSISGSSNKTINSIEQAKNQSKNTVVIEKKSTRFPGKSKISRTISNNDKLKGKSSFIQKTQNFPKSSPNINSDFEKRKLAEQRATKRIKGGSYKIRQQSKISWEEEKEENKINYI